MSAHDAEIRAARKALNAELQKRKVGQLLTHAASHDNNVILYQAVVHAFLYRLQFARVPHEEISARLRGTPASPVGAIGVSDGMRARLETSLGLVRSTEQERKRTNELLARIYRVSDDVPLDILLGIFVNFLLRFASKVGLPTDIAITRIENLDSLQRFAGGPKRYIPESQYGL